jgi:hypothetical protein
MSNTRLNPTGVHVAIESTGPQPWGGTAFNGLLPPKREKTWNVRAADFFSEHTDCDMSAFWCWEGLFGLGHDKHVSAAADLLRKENAKCPDGKQDAYGHSNGNRLIIHALLSDETIKLDDVHMFAPWLPVDCNENGINRVFERKQIKRLFIYASKADSTLWWNWCYPGRATWKLGRDGPRSAIYVPDLITLDMLPGYKPKSKIVVVRQDNFDHGHWIGGAEPLGFNYAVVNEALSLSAPAAVPA